MPKHAQPSVIIIGSVVVILVIGILFVAQIGHFFAPPVTQVDQMATSLEEPTTEPLRKKEPKKVAARRSSEGTKTLHASRPPSSAPALPQSASPADNVRRALSTAPAYRLPVEVHDSTLEADEVSPSWEEQYTQEQYLQEIEAIEDILQREFDPMVASLHLTAEQVEAIEEEIVVKKG